MTSSSDKGGKKGPDEPASETRAPEGLDDLMTNPAAAMAAATAFGFGMAAQMSKFFLGSLQGAMEVTGQLARQLEEERKAAEANTVAEAKVEAKAETPEPASAPAEVKAKMPVASKVKAKVEAPAKPVAAKVEKPKPAPKAKALAKPAAAPKVKAKPEPKVGVAAPAPKPKKASGKADDLKKIDGIGPKVEQVLKGRGITRYQDLVAMDDAALTALDNELGLDGRVLRDDWAGQARRLAGGKARSGK